MEWHVLGRSVKNLESPSDPPKMVGHELQNQGVIDPFLKGHGDSRYCWGVWTLWWELDRKFGACFDKTNSKLAQEVFVVQSGSGFCSFCCPLKRQPL